MYACLLYSNEDNNVHDTVSNAGTLEDFWMYFFTSTTAIPVIWFPLDLWIYSIICIFNAFNCCHPQWPPEGGTSLHIRLLPITNSEEEIHNNPNIAIATNAKPREKPSEKGPNTYP